MAYTGEKNYYYVLDNELRVVHIFLDCGGLKMAKKYKYSEPFVIHGLGDAVRLDTKVIEDKMSICHGCYNREQGLSLKEKRQPRPGFRTQPKGWVKPVNRVIKKTAKRQGIRDV